MKIRFNHVHGFGAMSQRDYMFTEVCGTREPMDLVHNLLEEGWCPWQNDMWYQGRSVRIAATHKPSRSTRKAMNRAGITYEVKPVAEVDRKHVRHRYEEFISQHNFNSYLDVDEILDFAHECIVIRANDENTPVAYTLLWTESHNMVSLQHVAVRKPYNLGAISQAIECEIASSRAIKYVYTMFGYDQSCKYKADFDGFEWWNGRTWFTTLKTQYKALCDRDSRIEQTLDLDTLFE